MEGINSLKDIGGRSLASEPRMGCELWGTEGCCPKGKIEGAPDAKCRSVAGSCAKTGAAKLNRHTRTRIRAGSVPQSDRINRCRINVFMETPSSQLRVCPLDRLGGCKITQAIDTILQQAHTISTLEFAFKFESQFFHDSNRSCVRRPRNRDDSI